MALINVEEDIKSSWKNTAGRTKINYFKLSSFSHLFYQPSPLLNNPVLFKKKLSVKHIIWCSHGILKSCLQSC